MEIIGYFGFVSLKFWLFEESGRLGVSEALTIRLLYFFSGNPLVGAIKHEHLKALRSKYEILITIIIVYKSELQRISLPSFNKIAILTFLENDFQMRMHTNYSRVSAEGKTLII